MDDDFLLITAGSTDGDSCSDGGKDSNDTSDTEESLVVIRRKQRQAS
jgi:hypothetical protein